MMSIDDYRRWLKDCLTIGIPAISVDTSARILAVVCVLGNNENMVMSAKCRVELEYMQNRFGINGGETPSAEIVKPLQTYIAELEEATEVPEWAQRIFKERYNIKLYK